VTPTIVYVLTFLFPGQPSVTSAVLHHRAECESLGEELLVAIRKARGNEATFECNAAVLSAER
jgi:hypothetical protein